ncbi:S-adenosyl methyltransferase [Prauserella shujinwangii]|uniref:S-adenosyl methyltransferase n=1 Tax=Prauserella shujinwangii TaxID=1453103 RepID=A0A2T0LL88_9PSEU|nr:SAM-dependent methyltransferase [Prauserella shujinwangii]PRX43715.1 S-adenosyl methyltransferase [Prauserella shujinwangii]
MVLPVGTAGQEGSTEPSIARMRDYWMAGSHHSDADREFAEHIAVCAPHLPYLVRAQRAWTERLVRFLVDQGVRQFLELGSGIPAERHVHEVAQEADPACRVVYTDLDPAIVAEGRALLDGTDGAAFVHADIREPDQVLGAADTQRLLDLAEPVAVLLIDTLVHVPESADPGALVAAYLEPLCSGSYLAISHFGESDQLTAGLGMFTQLFGEPPTVTLREPNEVARFFAGLELVPPGIVPVTLWRPTSEFDMGRNPELAQVHAGVGRKP